MTILNYLMIRKNLINDMDLSKLFEKYKIRVDPRFVLECWNQDHRHYHNQNHLLDLISQINEDYGNGIIGHNEKDKLMLTALFHELVYDPSRSDNQEKSAEIFFRFCSEQYNVDLVEVKQMILDTKEYTPCTPLSQKFLEYELDICSKDFDTLLEWEKLTREEYHMLDYQDYKKNRILFLESVLDKYPSNMDNLLDLINWLKNNH